MISASSMKLIRSLRQKKYRDHHGLYCAEGEKIADELIRQHQEGTDQVEQLFATLDWINRYEKELEGSGIPVMEVGPDEFKKVSNLVTPQPVLALVRKPRNIFNWQDLSESPVLGFESIRDPGNLGTILRTADWFGFSHIICTPDSVDLYNPKVVQSTMGAITRIKAYYLDFHNLFKDLEYGRKKVYGTFLEGEDIYSSRLDKDSLILFGNESRGLSDRFDRYIDARISIPSFNEGNRGSESLNIATSVAVICSELRRTSG